MKKEDTFSIFALQKDEQMILLFCAIENKEANTFRERVTYFLHRLMDHAKGDLGISITVGLSNEFEVLERAYIGYHQAILALERLFYLGTNMLIEYVAKDCCYDEIRERSVYQKADELIGTMQCLDSQNAKKNVLAIFELMQKNNVSSQQFREGICRIINQISATSLEFREKIEAYIINGFGVISYINALDTLTEIRDYFMEFIMSVIISIKRSRAERSKKIIEVAKEYILKNYCTNINLNSVSEYVHLNSTYFSELFKVETGTNFIDYVVETRINAAKKLLLNPELKVYEIGQKVGYDEPVSFNRAFKRVVGISPQEYRKIIG